MCRPFGMHAGVEPVTATFGGLDRLDPRPADLGTAGLITAEIAGSGGDLGAAIGSAVSWIAERLPVFALNLVLATSRWTARVVGAY